MKKRFIRNVAGLLSAILVINLCIWTGCGRTEAETVNIQPENPVYNAQADSTEWDYVYFGSYPQVMLSESELTDAILNAEYDDNGDAEVGGIKYRRIRNLEATYHSKITAEGFFNWNQVEEYAYFRYEPIKWRVLENDGDSLLLLTDQVLDCQKYERTDGKITWETCSIRNWLNATYPYNVQGFNFLTAAFSEEEQEAVLTTTVGNPKNPFHGTTGGKATQDKVFLPSIEEMTNEKYGFPSDYMMYSETRQLVASDYAKAMGVWMGTYNELYNGNAIWLLRSPGSYQQSVSLVYWFGHVYQDGYYANEPYYGVAPMIRVSAQSDLWKMEDKTSKVTIKSVETSDYTLSDANRALKIALGIEDATEKDNFYYDLDENAQVILDEVQEILKAALGIIDLQKGQWSPETPGESAVPTATTKPTPVPLPSDIPTAIPTKTPEPLVQTEHEASGKVWIAADSIAAEHAKSSSYSQPLYGWGELIGNYFENSLTLRFESGVGELDEYNKKISGAAVVINNTALSSRSTKSYVKEANYQSIMKTMGAGDYLLISFGHNDERACVDLYTDPFGSSSDVRSFKWFLKTYYIDPAIRAGVQPVLISPVARRYFYNGNFVNPQLHTPYSKAMQELVEEYAEMDIRIYYIGLHEYMLDKYEELGESGTAPLHGKYGNTFDHTHFSKAGATLACEFITEQMKVQQMNISKYMK